MKDVEAPLIRKESTSSKWWVVKLLVLSVVLVVVIFSTATSALPGKPGILELPVGTGLDELQIGDSVGGAEFGNNDAEEAVKEGMYLPVEIDINGEKEDADNIFWIGFKDDRKNEFKEEVTFKRHYMGPDCWSKWFNDAKNGERVPKTVELFIHVPQEKNNLHTIRMENCQPTRWEAGPGPSGSGGVEVINLKCKAIQYTGLTKKRDRKECGEDKDPRDCLSNEEYAKYAAGLRPLNMPEPPKKDPACGCQDKPTPCDCQPPAVPGQTIVLEKAEPRDPRDYLTNEEHAEKYANGPPANPETGPH